MLAELTRVDRIVELPVRGNTRQQVARQTGRP
jgi:hypothetical protein